ncbi:MAG: magnesium transporter NIPA-domain-containing protein [Benjaminiella poitrasii]|nr:MAG: magnesium transporter NIPA-domain-containing protein [Benjaminiella poitrasii]
MVDLEHPESGDVAFNTFIGVFVSICGNALISVALNLQKRAHNDIQERQMTRYFADIDESPHWISTDRNGIFLPDDGYSSPTRTFLEQDELIEQQKFNMTMTQEQTKSGDNTDYLKSKLWWLGILLMILGEVGNFVAYGFAPASTIAPLGTTTLVANVILAPLMLKEVFRKRDLIGVILAVTGAAMVVFSSNSEETALSPELIMESLIQMRSFIYFIFTGIAITTLTLLSPIYGSASIMIDLGLVAIYGGYTVLSTKSVASLLSLTFFKMFTYPVSYFLIFVLAITAILQIKYLNKALQRFDSTEVIPTQFVLFTISAIIGSAILYHDFDSMSLDQMSKFMSGCAVEFLGVYLITSKRAKNTNKASSSALSISADSGTTVVDFNTASDHLRVEENVNETLDHFSSTMSRPMNKKQRLSSGLLISTTSQQPAQRLTSNSTLAFETWQGLDHTTNVGNSHMNHNNNVGYTNGSHRRHSSVFRGISMASQLLDRSDEQQEQAIQLPLSSSPNNSRSSSSFLFSSHTKKRDSALLGNLFSGFTSVIGSNNHANDVMAEETDAVEIEIPTPSSFHYNESPLERELLPIGQNRKRDSARLSLVDLNEDSQQEYRDLS